MTTEIVPWPAEVPEPLSAPPLTNAPSDGPDVIAWIERNCVYGEGDHYGEAAKLELFEKLIIWFLFQKKPDGGYRYRRALIEMPKGNGKSALSSWLGLYLLCNRFSPVIPVAAASYDQAGLVFRDMQINVEESPSLRALLVAYEGEIRRKDGPGRAYKVFATEANDGARPTTILADEIHIWTSPKQERSHLVLTNGLSKRDCPLELNVTTPGFDRNSLAGRMHDYGVRVNTGEIKDPDFLHVWWGCEPERFDLETHDGVLAAIRAASPASDLFLNVNSVAAKYYQIDELEFHRYHLGVWTVSMDSWLPAGAWDSCADPSREIPDGARVVLGFDGSFSRDSTALVAVTIDGELPHVDVVECWERPANSWQGWKVPTLEVIQAVRDACRRYDVAEIAADTYAWRHIFEDLAEDGLPIVEFPQQARHMVPATERAYDAIREAGMTHSGDPRLTRHVANARAKATPRGRMLCKANPDSPDKIDLAVAMVMALDRAAAARPQEYDVLESVW